MRSGTNIYCSNCARLTPCRAVQDAPTIQTRSFPSLNLVGYVRSRECSICNLKFETVEVNNHSLEILDWEYEQFDPPNLHDFIEKTLPNFKANELLMKIAQEMHLATMEVDKQTLRLRQLKERLSDKLERSSFFRIEKEK